VQAQYFSNPTSTSTTNNAGYIRAAPITKQEQLAILTAFRHTENMQTTEKTVMIYTDSPITLDSLRDCNIHTFIIEEIRRQLNEMTIANWKIKLQWVKAQAGVRGTELVDELAKEAAAN